MTPTRSETFIPTFLLILFIISPCFSQSRPTLILVNGHIFTSENAAPSAQAIAISGDRIVSVGSDGDIRKLVAAGTRVIDLHGRTVIPGINDAHFHFMPHPEGMRLEFSSMEPTWDEVVNELKTKARSVQKGQWIFGSIGGKALADPRANRRSLDEISGENPVTLEAFYGHGMIINSMAMQRLGLK